MENKKGQISKTTLKSMNDPKVAVVIVTWNKKDDVLNLLNSLKGISYTNHDIFVVDNASEDGSAEAIQKKFPGAELIINDENLGGTGGFNTGIRRVAGEEKYKYIWLLDNDAEVRKDTLSNLVDVMQNDTNIGIVGSRILDTIINDITVEAGSYIRSDTIGVKPLYRNKRNLDIKHNTKEVDYVAICSALIRTDALKEVGLMDERYFIFWDDMDWGLQFKNKGYKVVSVLNSVVYHRAFTEKRGGSIVDQYYGNRNPLLTYSKHFNLYDRLLIFHRYLRHKCSKMMLSVLSGKAGSIKIPCEAIYDFIMGHWGKREVKNSDNQSNLIPESKNVEGTEIVYEDETHFPEKIENILFFYDGTMEDIYDAYNETVKIYAKAKYTLLIFDDRTDFFDKDFDYVIQLSTQKPYSLIYLSKVFLKIYKSKYDMAINITDVSPFSYAVKKSYKFNLKSNKLEETDHNIKNIWKLVLSTIAGEITGLLLLPVIYISSLRYKNQ